MRDLNLTFSGALWLGVANIEEGPTLVGNEGISLPNVIPVQHIASKR